MTTESKQANDCECREQSMSERRNRNPICPERVVLTLFLPGTAHVQGQCCQLFNFFFQKDQLSILNLTFLKVGNELKVIKTCVNQTTLPADGLQPFWAFCSLGLFWVQLAGKEESWMSSGVGIPQIVSDAKLMAGACINQWLLSWFGPNLFEPSQSHPPGWEERGLPLSPVSILQHAFEVHLGSGWLLLLRCKYE